MSDGIPDNLKVLVVGSGGREHALCWKIAQSKLVDKIFCAPGNGGTATTDKTENVDIPVMEFAQLSKFARDKKIDLVVIGPDDPLAVGIVDHLAADGLRVFGPDRQAAQMEASKAHAKEFMSAHHLPTARYFVADNFDEAKEIVLAHPWARVIKADGLALGKGVFVCDDENTDEAVDALTAIFKENRFGAAGERVIIEEKLRGDEMSLMVFCDGKRLLPMPAARDHKRRFDGDRGPNTGGMGAYAPADLFQRAQDEIESQVLSPIKRALASGQLPFKGVLYIGLMLEERPALEEGEKKPRFQPYVLEFNARFGDPETQVVLPLMTSDLVEVLWHTPEGKLDEVCVSWSKQSACCVVACAQTYPEKGSKGETITLGELPSQAMVFQAGTKLEGAGVADAQQPAAAEARLVTAGGRVLCVTGLGTDLDAAVEKAYEGLAAVSFQGMASRKDIGRRAAAATI